MNKKEPVFIKSKETIVNPTTELQKVIASELLYNEENECLEEIFEKGQEIGRTRNTENNTTSSE